MIRRTFSVPGALLACAVAVGCADLGPSNGGRVDVTLQRTDQLVTQLVSAWYGSLAGGAEVAGRIDADNVEALVVRVTRIEFLRASQEGEGAEAGGWVSLALDEPALLDLMALPTDGESPVVIASGSVEAGEYVKVRLFTDSTAIRLKDPLTVGRATFAADVDHPVTIPSGDDTGLKTDAGFTVESEAANDVHLLFSTTATFQNAAATGNGTILLAPVIRGRPEE